MKKTITLKNLTFATILFAGFSSQAQNIAVDFQGRYTDGRDGACEITAYDGTSQKLFITNAVTDSIDIIDCSNTASLTKTGAIGISTYGGGINSIAYLPSGHIAAAIQNTNAQANGVVVFFDVNGVYVNQLTVGALPDMLTVSKDGQKLLVACEGEPNDNYDVDPEGSIAIIDLSSGVSSLSSSNVTLLDFQQAPSTIAGGILKPNTNVAQDLEPEYIAISEDNSKAAVVCQENNVIVFVDLTNNSISGYKGLGFKDHSLTENAFDASDRDDVINITTHPVKGVYQPDAIYSYTVAGSTYFVTANEGDARDYAGYSSETRVEDLTLDAATFPDAATLQAEENLGRLKTFTADMLGDTDGDGDVDEIYSYGARSFSIWDENGDLVWDSGDDFAQYSADNFPTFFNCNSGEADNFDKRSDDKGSEPEAVTVGKIGNKFYAFIGLERQGGIMIYDVTTPTAPTFVEYIETFDVASGTSVDIAPEGIIFVPASESHTDENLLIVSNEVSGTTVIYSIEDLTSGTNELSNQKIAIYPNPTNDVVNIELPSVAESEVNYQLFNTYGQLLVSGEWTKQQEKLSLKNLSTGYYFLVVNGKNLQETTYKLVKQ